VSQVSRITQGWRRDPVTIQSQTVSLGADPEFVYVNTEQIRIIGASEVLGRRNYNSNLGIDGAGTAGELRPAYAWNAMTLTKTIRRLLSRSQRKIGTRPIVMIANNGFKTQNYSQSTGGHIHFGMTPTKEIVRALDCVSILMTSLQDKKQLCIRQGNSGYGRLGDYRLQEWGFEYRTPSSWLMTPDICAGVLALYHSVALEFRTRTGPKPVRDAGHKLTSCFNKIVKKEGMTRANEDPGSRGWTWTKWTDCVVPQKYNADIIKTVRSLKAYKENYEGNYAGLIDGILDRIKTKQKFPNLIHARIWGLKSAKPGRARTYPLFNFRIQDEFMQDISSAFAQSCVMNNVVVPRVTHPDAQIIVGGLRQENRPPIHMAGTQDDLNMMSRAIHNCSRAEVLQESHALHQEIKRICFRHDLRKNNKTFIINVLVAIAKNWNTRNTTPTVPITNEGGR
jgi:hypothetical protein